MNKSKRGMFALACMGLGALGGMAMLSTASANRADQSVIGSRMVLPYDGFLMLDGKGVNGQRYIRFELFDAATGGNELWEEEQSVQVYNGRFSAGLGSTTDLTSTVLDAEQLFISMTIVNRNSANVITSEAALSGRQEIKAAPFAAWSKDAALKNVADSLDVDGTFTDQGTLTVAQKTTVDGQMTSTGNLSSTTKITAANLTTTGSVSTPTLLTRDTLTLEGNLSTTGNDALGNGSGDTTTVNSATLYVGQDITFDSSGDHIIDGPSDIYGQSSIKIRRSASSSNDINITSSKITFGGDLAVEDAYNVRVEQLTVNGAATIDGDVEVGGNATVTGELPSTTSCPGSTIGTSSRDGRRLCVYEVDENNLRWYEASDRCWDNYGAKLCYVSQIRYAITSGIVSSSEFKNRYWFRDVVSDDRALYVDDNTTYRSFEDDANANSSDLDGAYCCLMLEY